MVEKAPRSWKDHRVDSTGIVTYRAAWALNSRPCDAWNSWTPSPNCALICSPSAAMFSWVVADHSVRGFTGRSAFPFLPAATSAAWRFLIPASVAPVAA